MISISLLPLGLYPSSENQVWCLQGIFLVRKPRVVPLESWGGNKPASVRGNPTQHGSSWPQSQAGLLLPSQVRVHRGVCTPQEAPGTSGYKNVPHRGPPAFRSCWAAGWVLGGHALWLLRDHTAQFPFSSTLALCVTLGKFLSLSEPKFLLLQYGRRHTSQLLVKIIRKVASCVLSSRLVTNVSFPLVT